MRPKNRPAGNTGNDNKIGLGGIYTRLPVSKLFLRCKYDFNS